MHNLLYVDDDDGTFKKTLRTFKFCKFYTIPYWTFITLY